MRTTNILCQSFEFLSDANKILSGKTEDEVTDVGDPEWGPGDLLFFSYIFLCDYIILFQKINLFQL